MVSKLERAVQHLNDKMSRNTDDELLIGSDKSKVSVKGTLVSATPTYTPAGVKITSDKYRVLIETAELKAKNIKIVRGTRIYQGTRTFEVIIDQNGLVSAEEQYNYRTIIHCKLLEC
jgi:hypothetical protein